MATMYKCDGCGIVFVSKVTKDRIEGGMSKLYYYTTKEGEDGVMVYDIVCGDLCLRCIGKMAKALKPGYEVVPSERVKRIVAPRKKKEKQEEPNEE